MPKQYLTVNEVARIIGVSPLTVRNWDQKGRLKAYRNPMNNYRLYKITDVEKLLEEIAQSRERKNFNPPLIHKSGARKISEANPEKKLAEEIIETASSPQFKKIKIEME